VPDFRMATSLYHPDTVIRSPLSTMALGWNLASRIRMENWGCSSASQPESPTVTDETPRHVACDPRIRQNGQFQQRLGWVYAYQTAPRPFGS